MVGTGLIWDTVYERLQEYNVTVLGAREPGVSEFHGSFAHHVLNTVTCQVGVGGVVLGGGLSVDVFR